MVLRPSLPFAAVFLTICERILLVGHRSARPSSPRPGVKLKASRALPHAYNIWVSSCDCQEGALSTNALQSVLSRRAGSSACTDTSGCEGAARSPLPHSATSILYGHESQERRPHMQAPRTQSIPRARPAHRTGHTTRSANLDGRLGLKGALPHSLPQESNPRQGSMCQERVQPATVVASGSIPA